MTRRAAAVRASHASPWLVTSSLSTNASRAEGRTGAPLALLPLRPTLSPARTVPSASLAPEAARKLLSWPAVSASGSGAYGNSAWAFPLAAPRGGCLPGPRPDVLAASAAQ
eukprot:365424-Chlamydomonas_euryale.AAC.12